MIRSTPTPYTLPSKSTTTASSAASASTSALPRLRLQDLSGAHIPQSPRPHCRGRSHPTQSSGTKSKDRVVSAQPQLMQLRARLLSPSMSGFLTCPGGKVPDLHAWRLQTLAKAAKTSSSLNTDCNGSDGK